MRRFRILMAVVASTVMVGGSPVAAQEAGDSFIRLGVARTKLVDKGEVKTNGVLDPAAGYATREAWHGVVSGGYFIRDNIAIEGSISTPLTTNNLPAGSLAGLPNLGDDEFITATLGVSYHPIKGPVSPYVGAGIQYQRTTQERDGLAVGLNIPNAHGPYVSGGVNFALTERFGFFAEARKSFYHTNATGLLPLGTGANGLPGAPFAQVDAKAELDPLTIQVGVVARFGRSTAASAQPPIDVENRGFIIKAGITHLELADRIKLNVGGAPFPGADLSTFEHITPTVQFGYFLTRNIAVNATVGIPPKIDIFGGGSIGPLGKLGKLRYGPMTLTAQYHPVNKGRIRPYVGAGVAYMHVFSTKDGSFEDLDVANDFGAAAEAGVELLASNKVGIFFDVKKAFLRSKATGSFGGAPVAGRAKIDPWAFTTGVSFRF